MPLLEPLQVCLGDFKKTGEILHRMTPNMTAIENLAQTHLTNKPRLTSNDLEQFFRKSEPHWWIGKFWHIPKTMLPILLPHPFQKLNENNENLFIDLLLQNIKQIELVSIILRFVRPDSYGILSPPVERVLNVRWGSNAVETYLHYLEDLRKIKKNFKFLKRVADVDMALWVLHAKYFQNTDSNNTGIRKYYETDPFLIQLRTKNIMEPLRDLNLKTISLGLHRVRPRLAAAALCYLFEMAVRDLDNGFCNSLSGEFSLATVINGLEKKMAENKQFIGNLRKLNYIRNRFLHHDQTPTEIQLQEFIKSIQSIEEKLSSSFKYSEY